MLALTVFPGSPAPYRWLVDEVGAPLGPDGLAAALNVLLFIPIGAMIALTRRRRLLWLAPALSVTIEMIQWLIPERNPDPRDVVFNTAGALIGYGIVALTRLAHLRLRSGDAATARERR